MKNAEKVQKNAYLFPKIGADRTENEHGRGGRGRERGLHRRRDNRRRDGPRGIPRNYLESRFP